MPPQERENQRKEETVREREIRGREMTEWIQSHGWTCSCEKDHQEENGTTVIRETWETNQERKETR